jgi:hypothetical protein
MRTCPATRIAQSFDVATQQAQRCCRVARSKAAKMPAAVQPLERAGLQVRRPNQRHTPPPCAAKGVARPEDRAGLLWWVPVVAASLLERATRQWGGMRGTGVTSCVRTCQAAELARAHTMFGVWRGCVLGPSATGRPMTWQTGRSIDVAHPTTQRCAGSPPTRSAGRLQTWLHTRERPWQPGQVFATGGSEHGGLLT